MKFKYSVFTVMTPDLTVEEVPRVLAEMGYDGVEWRVRQRPESKPERFDYWRANMATLNEENLLEELKTAKRLCSEYGLEIPALGTYLRCSDKPDRIEKVLAAAAANECPQVRVGVPRYDGSIDYNKLFAVAVEQYKVVEKLAKKYGVRANIEIHMGTICPSAGLAYRFVSNFDPEYVGVIYDPGNMVHEGFENWQLGLELLGPYLAHVHVKNACWKVVGEAYGAKVWRPFHAPLKEGQVNWYEVLRALRRVSYEGWLSFEDFSEGDTLEKLRSNIEFMKNLEAKL